MDGKIVCYKKIGGEHHYGVKFAEYPSPEHARPAILPSTVSTMPQPTRPKRFRLRTGAALACLLALNAAMAKDWYVGPQRTLKLPSQAARLAGDGDTVHIDAAVYSGDVAVWPQHRLTLRGSGGWARLHANGLNAEGKAIWVIKGDRVVVENIEFTGAEAQALNGAGIRYEGRLLTLRHCHVHHNQMGLLTGADPEREILIEGSEFNDNTVDYRLHGKLGHNVYIGNIKRFTLRNSYIHDAATGHNVKSRAKFNFLLYNHIGDEQRASSYLVDLPDGGESYLIGNQLYQAADSENPAMVSFAAEHNQAEPYTLYLVNNTLVNAKAGSYFLHNHNVAEAVLINNLLVGQAATIQGPFRATHNVWAEQELFADGGRFDYRLRAEAGAIDQGVDPGISATGVALAAEFEYRHPWAWRLGQATAQSMPAPTNSAANVKAFQLERFFGTIVCLRSFTPTGNRYAATTPLLKISPNLTLPIAAARPACRVGRRRRPSQDRLRSRRPNLGIGIGRQTRPYPSQERGNRFGGVLGGVCDWLDHLFRPVIER
ncbi:right-handed parallel beta-helix repeat-containing protein [Methylomonas koyamae]|uniref:right-handed parallel beta-helix repeat-containing protein n=1 Tax=Methylomonas koyamae TaxID=702114 RepID=UPI0006D29A7C|nr:right-handed parallel beta-helix repeat-containing protein [Methylomonas koyamae]